MAEEISFFIFYRLISGCKGIFDDSLIGHKIVIAPENNSNMNRFVTLLLAMLVFAGCHTGDNSPFAEILSQPPYQALTDSIKKEPRRDDLYFRRAVLLNKNNFPEPALADFQKAWSLSRQEGYALGISNLLLEKNAADAIGFLKQAVKDVPNSLLLQLGLARAYAAQNKPDEALSVCQAILEKQPDQLSVLLLQADLLEKKGDTTGAVSALEKAYTLAPRNMDISYQLAYQYAETRNAKVIALTDTLISRDSLKLYAHPYYVKGVYYTNINDKARAIRFFNEAIRQDYNYLNAYIEKGKILLQQGKTAEALKTFRLANTISPSFADAWYWIGKCEELAGHKEEAKLNYEKAYGLDKTFTEAKEAAERIN
jgi:tetratricopeptide (TPR) repeat protein